MSFKQSGVSAFAAVLTILSAPASPARAAVFGPPTGPVPVALPVFEPGDIFGTVDRPGPSFMIAASLTLTETAFLNFGTVIAPSSGTGNVTITPSNAQSYDTTNSTITADLHSEAQFTVGGGKSGKTYVVSLPTSGTIGGGITLISFTSSSPDNYTFDGSGNSTLHVGATAQIPANESTATYSTGTSGALTCTESRPSRVGTSNLTGISIKIAKPMSLSKVSDLKFGDIVAGALAGTVVLTSAGVRTSSGGVTLGNSTGVSAGAFTLTGESAAAYIVTITPTTLALTGPGTSMTVDTWSPNPSSGTLPSTSQAITLGGTLHVGASQTAGTYSGILTISTNYQ